MTYNKFLQEPRPRWRNNSHSGVAMGSPLAPVLSNLFMGHHEKSWLENFQDSEILFYRRYVDDTFCLFHSEHEALLFFNYIIFRHPNIRGCLHDTGASFAPELVHSGSISWLYISLHDTTTKCHAGASHPGSRTGARISLRYEISQRYHVNAKRPPISV